MCTSHNVFDKGPNLFQPDNDPAKHESRYRCHYAYVLLFILGGQICDLWSTILSRNGLSRVWRDTELWREDREYINSSKIWAELCWKKTALEFGESGSGMKTWRNVSRVDKNESYQRCIPHRRDRGKGNIKELTQEYLQQTASCFPLVGCS